MAIGPAIGHVQGTDRKRQSDSCVYMRIVLPLLIKGIRLFESSLPSPRLVLRSQTTVKDVWLCETGLHHCSAHSSKIARMFDSEAVSVNNKYTHLSAMRVTGLHMTIGWTNSHRNGRQVTEPIATAFLKMQCQCYFVINHFCCDFSFMACYWFWVAAL